MESSNKSYDLVLQDIEQDLRSGRLSLGDRLPGERALALKYEISRASVRDAIRVLSVLGVVKSSPGSGPDSGTQIVANPSVGLSHALRLHMAASSLPADDVIESRILLETWGARGAARRVASGAVTQDDLAPLWRLLEDMDAEGITSERFHILDTQFHTDLTVLADNTVIATMMESLREAVRSYVMEGVGRLADWDAVACTLREQHRAILRTVSEGRDDDAARLVEEHIRWFDAVRKTAESAETPESADSAADSD